MKIVLLVVGKTTDKPVIELIELYKKRLSFYLPFEIEVISELKNAKSLTFEQQKDRESDLILKSINDNDHVVLLDERGKEFSSVQFAQFIQKKMVDAQRRVVFIVGGPYGFHESIYRRGNEMLSISKMTFSHQMIRLLFVEQLYRAMTILNHEPYHHE